MRIVEIMDGAGTSVAATFEVMKSDRYIDIQVEDRAALGLGGGCVGISVDIAEAAQIIEALSAAIAEQYAEERERRRRG